MMISEVVENDGPIIAVSGPNFNIFGRCWEPFVVSNAVSRLSLSSSTPEIFALKLDIELRSRRK